MMVGLKRISTVVGLLAVTASVALGQGTVANPNQTTADSVANALRSSRTLAGSRIEIEAQDGLVSLTGTLASPGAQGRGRGAGPERPLECRAWSTGSRSPIGRHAGPVSSRRSPWGITAQGDDRGNGRARRHGSAWRHRR